MKGRVFSIWRTKAEEAEDRAWGPSEMAQRRGNVVIAVAAQQAKYRISQGGEGLGSGPGADLTGILPQRHIAHIVQPILDVPVLADQAQELAGGDLRAPAGHE